MSQNLIAHWSFDEGKGNRVREKCTGREDEVRYVFNEALYKPSSEPLWVDGVKGGALLFDGYSTWISAPALTNTFKAMTIQGWVAPRSYEHGDGGRLSAIVGQHDRETKTGFVLGMFRHGAWSFQIGTGEAWYEVWAEADPIPRDAWSHVAAVFDGVNGSMTLYLNGKQVARTSIPPYTEVRPAQVDLLIGKNNKPSVLHGTFATNMFNGIIDELRLYDRALSTEEVKADCDGVSVGSPDTAQRRSRYAGDRHRPHFHFIPPEHWMNEPHGPMYFNGQYHIFYQHNPQGPYWNQIHWGHAVSSDMLRWRDVPFALSPEKGSIDPDGCWSGGTAVNDDGVPVIFYAAGDKRRNPDQSVALAISTYGEDGNNDLVDWVKHPEYVAALPEGEGLPGNFRDPFVWKEDGTWYMIVTSGIPGKGGTALLYTSENMTQWTYRNPIYVGDSKKYPKTGDAWELPLLFPFYKNEQGEQKHIFIVNPWFLHASPHYCKYIFYWVGTWDPARLTFIPDDEEPQVFDVGEHWIGPSGFVDPSGRIILFSVIFGMNPRISRDLGWFGNAGLPVEIAMRPDGRPGIQPIKELETLRGPKLVEASELSFEAANECLNEIQGDLLEIKLELEPGEAERLGIKVRVSPDGMEETLLYYDKASASFMADRNKSSMEPDVEKGIEGGPVDLDGDNLRLHIYLDKSMIEAYINGIKSLTTRIFPFGHDAQGLKLMGDSSIVVKSLEIWEMQSAYRV
ncbi:GH32 C-terminal domain-containing protein [Cohnella hashimotonis]|uniref:beta-fructofuranosidase n=1 Tax=Cohnella hashimotonis TaxID=2826895 RepID=A0ABT6TC49_9BACL|nr:GH32 C-terminal domain-containing protein [Cohnella hashimotonis]MDI4643524.1 GH32 C-terminal domain-containing protein [Cohnella hashimotonis]